MEQQWKDSTSYSQRDKERIPSSFTLTTPSNMRVNVTNKHIYNPGNWTLSTYNPQLFDTHNMNIESSVDKEIAQEAAIKLVVDKLNKMVNELSGE